MNSAAGDPQRADQARQQARAGNGQFIGHTRTSPRERAYYDEERNALLLDGGPDRPGTYDFPPVPRDRNGLIDFWMTVEIPDSALDAAMRVHSRRFEIVAERARQSYLSRNPRPEGIRAEVDGATWREGLKNEVAGWIRDNPSTAGMASTMPRAQVRGIVRAAQMWHHACQWLPEEEQAQVAAISVRLPTARRDSSDPSPAYEDTTVGNLVLKWRTHEIVDQFHDRAGRDLERLVNQKA